MSRTQSEKDLCFWYLQRDAKLGVSASGFEGSGGPTIWDDARNARAHGIAVDESGAVEVLHTGRLSPWYRDDVRKAAQITETFAIVPVETKKLLDAAFASDCSDRFVSLFFWPETYTRSEPRAPLVGLALLLWYEAHPNERKSPAELLASWNAALDPRDDLEGEKKARQVQINAQARKLLGPLRSKTIEHYFVALDVFDACASHLAKARKSEPTTDAEYVERELRQLVKNGIRRRRSR